MAEQVEPKSKQEILELIGAERRRLQDVVGKLSDKKMLTRDLEGKRSVKDILAHISAWEQLMVQWIEESYAGVTPQRPAPGTSWDNLDQLNQQIYQENKNRSLDDIRNASIITFAQAYATVNRMNKRDLFDGARFPWRNGDPMWHMVAANTWWHYQEHREQIEAWLRGNA